MVAVAKEKHLPGGFAAKLRAFRTESGWTQTELAQAVGIGRMTYIRYETGESEPTWTILCRLAEELGRKPNDFLDQCGTD